MSGEVFVDTGDFEVKVAVAFEVLADNGGGGEIFPGSTFREHDREGALERFGGVSAEHGDVEYFKDVGFGEE